ncbi:unnamed protein product, partial [Sphacelaria rigidula]
MSLVGNTTSGVLGFTTKITRSVGGGVAALSFDEEFQRRRIRRRREAGAGEAGGHRGGGKGARGAATMITHAVRDLGGGIYHGVTGVIVEPYRRTRDDGLRGLAVGLCYGVAGVATKPMVGCLDAVTHTGEAVREMAGGLAAGDAGFTARRVRFPQPFGPDGRMMPRTAETACGAILLARFPLLKARGRHARGTILHLSTAPTMHTPTPGDVAMMDGGPIPVSTLPPDDSMRYRIHSWTGSSPFPGAGGTDDNLDGSVVGAGGRGWASPSSEPGSPEASPARTRTRASGSGITGTGGVSMLVQPKDYGRRRSRQSIFEPDFVVSTEFLPRSRTEAVILVISNRRFLCVRAYVRGGSGGGSGEWS